jgi:hypothetical protein
MELEGQYRSWYPWMLVGSGLLVVSTAGYVLKGLPAWHIAFMFEIGKLAVLAVIGVRAVFALRGRKDLSYFKAFYIAAGISVIADMGWATMLHSGYHF